jgi:PTS system nitrogen regulatory IIA component
MKQLEVKMVLAVLDSIDSYSNISRFEDYLRLQQIVKLHQSSSRNEALAEMLEQLSNQNIIEDIGSIRQALVKREQYVSTCLGKSFALPHARLPDWRDFIVSIGMHSKGVSWGSHDGLPVKLIFLIIGPEDKQLEYLKLVSYIAELVRDEHACKILLSAQTPKEIFNICKTSSR